MLYSLIENLMDFGEPPPSSAYSNEHCAVHSSGTVDNVHRVALRNILEDGSLLRYIFGCLICLK
jgi:hypothetical protein